MPVDVGVVGVWVALVDEFMIGLIFSKGFHQDLFRFPAHLLLFKQLCLSLPEIKLQGLKPDFKIVILSFEVCYHLELCLALFHGVFVLLDKGFSECAPLDDFFHHGVVAPNLSSQVLDGVL